MALTVDHLPLAPPLPASTLNRVRLGLRGKLPGDGLGVHRHRLQGQSLQFRDFRTYVPGEDIRKVDWTVSVRQGFGWRKDGLHITVREFEAEVRRTMIVLIDCRLTMTLPQAMPKLVVAGWIAQCLGYAALAENDRLIVAPLFTGQRDEIFQVTKTASLTRLQTLVARQFQRAAEEEAWHVPAVAQIESIAGYLDSTAAVVLISDMLFDDRGGGIARLSNLAQRGYRSLHVIEIDSWAYEKALLRQGPFRLAPLEGKRFGGEHCEATDGFLQEASDRLAGHKRGLRRSLGGPGLVWPSLPFSLPVSIPKRSSTNWFAPAFFASRFLPALLSRTAA